MSDITGILEDLAAGRIGSAEAERRIAASRTDSPPPMPPAEASAEWAAPPQPGAAPEPPPAAGPPPAPWTRQGRAEGAKAGAVERVLVKAAGRRVRVVATPGVRQAMAEGIHQTRRRGEALEILSEVELTGVGAAFNFLKSVRGLDDLKSLGVGQELTVHVNPELTVDLDVAGGSVTTSGVRRLGQVRLTAGVAHLGGVAEVGDLVAQAGQATVAGCFRSGLSRLRVESGQLTVRVDPDSDVTVNAEARVGHVSWDTKAAHTDTTLVVHGGMARLDVSAVMGYAAIKVGADEADDLA
ncbi:MAG: hypothetical protein LBH76_00245 [Propionibacteriaceae bacterium]|jgi:hypothetical protein|nr:hypothetical protein [Propionibacteriaceae bacterium]